MKIPDLSSLFNRTRRSEGWFVIALGNKGVHFAQVKQTNTMPQVVMCTFYPVTNVTPVVLEKLRKDAHIGGFQFITLLPPGEYQIQLVDAPNVPVDELKTAVRWRIKDMLSYHVDDATVDVLQIPASKFAGERPQSLFAIAAANATVQKRVSLFESAKIKLSVIDIPETAQRNIAALFEEGDRVLAMLSFDDAGGLFTLTRNGELYFGRRLDITLGQLQDADESLRQQSLERVGLEVRRSLDYFEHQYRGMVLSRLLIAAPEHLDLVAILTPELGLPVEQLDLAHVLDISAVPELADSEYAASALFALGAALRRERRAL